MTRDEFLAGPAVILDGGFPGEFTAAEEAAYFFLLGDVEAEAVMTALKAWRQKWRPAAPEIIALLEPEGASVPTADELLRLLDVFLYVRVRGRFADQREQAAAVVAERRRRLEGMHPLAASFLDRHGERFRGLPLLDDEGKWNRKELFQAWADHVVAMEGRSLSALALGMGREGLRALDPLAALGLGDPSQKQLGSG